MIECAVVSLLAFLVVYLWTNGLPFKKKQWTR